ncbi:MAG TPA: ammonium transporter [Steroidobacteraceae bacterium]|jgi:Amt family ammonium transporter|nr:ammonium transporter [Steroidobacteraceae bacterium]
MNKLPLLACLAVLTLHSAEARADDLPSAPTATQAAAAPAAAAAAAPATEPKPSAPTLTGVDKISAGDTAWMLTSTALVLMMSIPGLALFYGGMVRKKNVLATLMQTFAIVCVVTILWWLIGYSWAFTPGSKFLGGSSRALFNGMTFMQEANKLSVSHLALTIPETVYSMFQLTFAVITPALIAGAFADRMKFSAMLVFMGAWSLLVYAPIAHMVWEPTGWLNLAGVLDFAGGTVVHINAGIAGLASCLVLGKRLGYGREAMPPHNLTLTLMGASLLWVGWFGFNAGSAGAADGRAGMAMLVTQLATAAAALGWMFAEWVSKGKPSVLGIASGAVAGLVAITPASGFVGPTPAVIIGVAAGVLCFIGATSLKHALGYDDSLDAFGVHGIGGIIGALLTGVFVSKEISGVDGSVLVQFKGVAFTVVYGFVASFVILKIIDMTIGLRVSEEQEREGLDISLHGESIE